MSDPRELAATVDATDERSPRTGSRERSIEGSATRRPNGTDEVYCWNCGNSVAAAAEICPGCGVRQRPPPTENKKNPGVAALLSAVWTGAGQIYNGDIGRGIALMALMFVSTVSIVVAIGFVTTPLIWGYAIYDAYRTAENSARNREFHEF